MIKILYFASVKEKMGVSEEVLSLPSALLGEQLLAQLIEKGEPWRTALGEGKLLFAVNQEMVALDHVVADGDEVAFFPPVTGG